MDSRLEELLKALLNGETVDFKPQSRMEEYLLRCIEGGGTEGLPTPSSRVDALLYALAEKGVGGSGTLEELVVTENGVYEPTSDEIDGYNKVRVNVVPDGFRVQEKEAIANGEVVPDNGYDGLSKVTVNVPRSLKKVLDASRIIVKLFNEVNFYHWGGSNYPPQISDFIEYDDTSNVTEIYDLFYYCDISVPIPLLNTSKVKKIEGLIYHGNINTPIPLFDTSNVTSVRSMFSGVKFEDGVGQLPLFNTSKVTSMERMFFSCTFHVGVGRLPLFDCSNVINMTSMFASSHFYQDEPLPLFNTSNVTKMDNMFAGCNFIKGVQIPLFDTSKVTSMYTMFSGCKGLTSIPSFDTSNVTDIRSLVARCTDLTSIPVLNTSKVTSFSNMFQDCTNLTLVESLDLRSASSDPYAMFLGCTNLTNIHIKNIKRNLTVGSGTSYGHLLTVDSLVSLIYELINVNSSRTLTIGSANLEKLTNVYVKTIEITDEMRAEDEFIDKKIPFVVCESTDEGAMLITDYVGEKKWQLA